MRKIFYVSGTRADYGLMRNVLLKLHTDPEIDLAVCATGMHLSGLYGNTINEIEADGLAIAAKIPVDVESSSTTTMAKGVGHALLGFIEVFEKEKPDLVLLLGDRGEMLAGAIAAAHLNIPIAHIHGGERSGTVDEMVRHAISKFSHFHFVATEEARTRLVRMGELPDNIFLVGAPGLDEIVLHTPISRSAFFKQLGFDEQKALALVVFHPVVQDHLQIAAQFENLLQSVVKANMQIVCFEPNSDAGGHLLREILAQYRTKSDIQVVTHMHRSEYLNCLACADLMIGNSSSGIIEAASFHLPVVNVGSRQNLRERSANVVDTSTDQEAIEKGIEKAMQMKGKHFVNVYGDGKTADRCQLLLKQLSLSKEILNKYNAY